MPQHTIDRPSAVEGGRQPPASRWLLHPLSRTVRDLFQRAVLLPVSRWFAHPLQIEGVENLAGHESGLILAANHQSHADTAILLAALPASLRRRLVIAAAADVIASNRVVAILGQIFFGA